MPNSKILVLGYHSLPFDVVASYRTESLVQHLAAENKVSLVTFDWIKKEFWEIQEGDNRVENHKNIEIHRIGKPSYSTALPNNTFLNKVNLIRRWANGKLDPFEMNGAVQKYKEYVFNNIDFSSVDLVYAIYSPHFTHQLAYEIKQKYNVPYILDYRDLWNNRVASVNYSPGIKERIEDYFVKRNWRKWLKHSSLFTITSETWKEVLKAYTSTTGIAVPNGFEESLLTKPSPSDPSKFTITFAGNLYPAQEITIFCDGFNQFLRSLEDSSLVVLKLVGVGEHRRPGILKEFKSKIPSENLQIIKKLPREDAFNEQLASHILWYPAFSNIRGWCSVKVYDYLATGRKILVAPGDNSTVDEIMRGEENASIAMNSNEVADQLNSWFSLWVSKSSQMSRNINEGVRAYSRETQMLRLLNYLNENKLL